MGIVSKGHNEIGIEPEFVVGHCLFTPFHDVFSDLVHKLLVLLGFHQLRCVHLELMAGFHDVSQIVQWELAHVLLHTLKQQYDDLILMFFGKLTKEFLASDSLSQKTQEGQVSRRV